MSIHNTLIVIREIFIISHFYKVSPLKTTSVVLNFTVFLANLFLYFQENLINGCNLILNRYKNLKYWPINFNLLVFLTPHVLRRFN